MQVDVVFGNGTQSVINVLLDKLKCNGVQIKVNAPVRSICNWDISNKIVTDLTTLAKMIDDNEIQTKEATVIFC